jgi:translocation and assembly module TamB
LKPDLLASGAAKLDASIQGTTDDPQLNGKLSFQNASFYLRDVITGLDKVNGELLFDKSRATIESLKAQTGGGELQLTGFVGFGKLISYRLQAQATQVRLRYPEGVSTSANATLALTGTTAQSILTGNVVILRSSIGQIDTGQLLVGNSGIEDASTQTSNEFLRNLQFDVRIDAAENVEFSTAFTKDVKGEIALRLRGTPQRPIVLGRIAATQGEVDFFGARYQINRGEVLFSNPLRIDPVVSLDLETRVRGVAISINFNGPASKLNMSYRSDPPLQSSEILALLTVGRNPGSTSPVAQGPVGQNQGMFGNDSSVIVGAAVTAGINGRLQRFFGISRVRLDPQLTGIDNVPQARLTLEQQVSRDVTLTYITNLNRTQQQIVRIDWDISKAWSVVAVRDENGIFGLDLSFRKRIK